MSADNTFRKATRRLLFTEEDNQSQNIPGAGRSAAESADRHVRVKVTMNLDSDVIQYFKQWAKQEGRAYQSLVNQVLREYIDGSRPEQLAATVRELLLEDPDFLKQLKEQLSE